MAFGLTPEKTEALKKSPVWPAMLSGLVAPGLGQIANREFLKGVFLLFASVGSILYFSKVLGERLLQLLPGPMESWSQNPDKLRQALLQMATQDPGMFLTFDLLILSVWAFSIVDAYVTARRRHARPSHETDPAAR